MTSTKQPDSSDRLQSLAEQAVRTDMRWKTAVVVMTLFMFPYIGWLSITVVGHGAELATIKAAHPDMQDMLRMINEHAKSGVHKGAQTVENADKAAARLDKRLSKIEELLHELGKRK